MLFHFRTGVWWSRLGKRLAVCVCLCLFSALAFAQDPCDGVLDGDYEISASVEVDESLANLLIDTQINDGRLPLSATGNLDGLISYQIELGRVHAAFTPDRAELHLSFSASAVIAGSPTPVYRAEIRPRLDIGRCRVTTGSVLASLEGLVDELRDANLPDWLVNAFLAEYGLLELEIYRGQLLEALGGQALVNQAITIADLGIAFAVVDGALQFIVAAGFDAERPKFEVSIATGGGVYVWANLEVEVVVLKVFTSEARYLTKAQPGMTRKNQTTLFRTDRAIGPGSVVVYGEFRGGGSVYAREWIANSNGGIQRNTFN